MAPAPRDEVQRGLRAPPTHGSGSGAASLGPAHPGTGGRAGSLGPAHPGSGISLVGGAVGHIEHIESSVPLICQNTKQPTSEEGPTVKVHRVY